MEVGYNNNNKNNNNNNNNIESRGCNIKYRTQEAELKKYDTLNIRHW